MKHGKKSNYNFFVLVDAIYMSRRREKGGVPEEQKRFSKSRRPLSDFKADTPCWVKVHHRACVYALFADAVARVRRRSDIAPLLTFRLV